MKAQKDVSMDIYKFWMKINQLLIVIMDNFKGQIGNSVIAKLEGLNILIYLLSSNTTGHLQPLSLAIAVT